MHIHTHTCRKTPRENYSRQTFYLDLYMYRHIHIHSFPSSSSLPIGTHAHIYTQVHSVCHICVSKHAFILKCF